jgi:dihydropteroate synthase
MAARSHRLRPSAAPHDTAAAASTAVRAADGGGLERAAAVRALLEGGRTLVMGVVNATPDSFHVPSRSPARDAALAAAERLIADGADLLDVGGESTRPGATPVALDVELARVLPVVHGLRASGCTVPISIDTYKAEVARAAVVAGASLVNDVSGGLLDEGMARTVAALGVPVIVGHLRGTPHGMAAHATYRDVLVEVRDELGARIAAFVAAGVPAARILVDPGIGFAKRAPDNLLLLRRLDELRALGRPIVVGLSRKRFIDEAMRAAGLHGSGSSDERLEGSLAAAVLAAERGAAVIRTHDVAATRRALAIADAILHEA